MDFTIKTYKSLLESLQSAGFFFITFEEYFSKQKPDKWVILRHDVDLLPENSLRFAKIQHELGIKGTYYFRAVPESWDERIIKEIADLGHEVGYHYETMDSVNSRFEFQISDLEIKNIQSDYLKLLDKAYEDFCENLEKLRKLVPVSTICMHGSPKSRFDNKDIWKKYDYKELDILGEPYYDVNFDEVFYLTDTGRRWDGYKVSVRDKLPQQENWNREGLSFHSTYDIISAIGIDKIPEKIMFTFHPQRWHDKPIPWFKEYFMQNTKNIIKYYIIKRSK
jgi:hypothetical protein